MSAGFILLMLTKRACRNFGKLIAYRAKNQEIATQLFGRREIYNRGNQFTRTQFLKLQFRALSQFFRGW